MKLSAKKRGQIYDTIHEIIVKKRIELRLGLLKDNVLMDKMDYHIGQLEIPIAHTIFRLLDKDYK
jgi:hypothetical protein